MKWWLLQKPSLPFSLLFFSFLPLWIEQNAGRRCINEKLKKKEKEKLLPEPEIFVVEERQRENSLLSYVSGE